MTIVPTDRVIPVQPSKRAMKERRSEAIEDCTVATDFGSPFSKMDLVRRLSNDGGGVSLPMGCGTVDRRRSMTSAFCSVKSAMHT